MNELREYLEKRIEECKELSLDLYCSNLNYDALRFESIAEELREVLRILNKQDV